MPPHRRPYCQATKPTRAGLNRHISQNAACHSQWRDNSWHFHRCRRKESEEPDAPPVDPETLSKAASPVFFSHEVPDEKDDDGDGIVDFVSPLRAIPEKPDLHND
ncbi:hypothetical protein B0H13DRAFT_2301498 [Mycena leptocephala]|nr:hypothetical protein B0H13DRAFT_2301498 [Mycena leptocephala]